ncbi:MAG: sugar transferase [Patescibacteria group bacterium]
MFILTRIKQIILLFGDIILLFFSLYITLYIRYSQTYIRENWQDHFYPFAILYFVWVLIFYSQNLYNLNYTKNNIRFFRTFMESFVINILTASFFFYFTPFFGIAPKTNLFLTAGIAGLFLVAWRFFYNIIMAKYIFKNKIAFLGYSKEVEELLAAFKNEPQLGYECVCVVDEEEKNIYPGVRRISLVDFMQNIGELKIDTIAIHYGKSIDRNINNELYRLIFSDITFINSLKLYEEITAKLPIETLSEGWFLDNLQESEKKVYDRIKIAIDYLLAGALGIILLAIFLPVALLTLITSGRPIFYTQTRIGKNGKEFKIHKFRTMIKNAEDGRAQFAQKNDSRVTSFGKFLRQTRIDELPQVLNILRGEMSFIGPRPERPEFVSELAIKAPFYPLRHLAKPGLTGWAQINYNYAGSIEENLKKLQYDIYYIKNRSFLLDMTILLKTFNIIFRFKGM